MPIVKFVNENKEIEVPEGAKLRTEAVKAGINTNCGVNGYGAGLNKYINCKGLGLCGTCRVLITQGIENTNDLTMIEKVKFRLPLPPDPLPCLAYIGNEDQMRLACKVEIKGDIEVQTCPEFNLFGANFFS